MSGLVQGQTLKCGCVVGHYWCGPHDIYARRTERTVTWNERDGVFYLRTLEPNAHRPASYFRPLGVGLGYRDDESGSCSCHINPPCSWCVDQPDPDEADAARSAREGE